MSDPTVVESTMILRVAAHWRRHGFDPDPGLHQAGIDPASLDDRDRLHPFASTLRFYDVTARAFGNRAVGLDIARESSPRDYGLQGLIWGNHPTLDAAFDTLSHIYSSFMARASLDVERREDGTHILCRYDHEHVGLDVFRTELLATIYLQSRAASSAAWTPQAVRFALPQLAPASFRELFGVDVTFDADEDELIIAPDHLAQPIPGADPLLLAHLLEAAETHLGRRKQAAEAQERLLHLAGCTIDLSTSTVHRQGEGAARLLRVPSQPRRHPRRPRAGGVGHRTRRDHPRASGRDTTPSAEDRTFRQPKPGEPRDGLRRRLAPGRAGGRPAVIPLLLRPGRRPMFPPVDRIRPGPDGLVALGGDLLPETLLEAYGKGLFPWDGRPPIPWYSTDPRLILEPKGFKASASLRKLARQRKLEIRYDTAFRAVMLACAVTPRPGQAGSWITRALVDAYGELHECGVAHSVEAWNPEGRLVGGLYGLSMGRAFFGESMFAHARDASKLALHDLCTRLAASGYHFVDCQQDTPHLRSLGAFLVPRQEYLDRLALALEAPSGWDQALAADGA